MGLSLTNLHLTFIYPGFDSGAYCISFTRCCTSLLRKETQKTRATRGLIFWQLRSKTIAEGSKRQPKTKAKNTHRKVHTKQRPLLSPRAANDLQAFNLSPSVRRRTSPKRSAAPDRAAPAQQCLPPHPASDQNFGFKFRGSFTPHHRLETRAKWTGGLRKRNAVTLVSFLDWRGMEGHSFKQPPPESRAGVQKWLLIHIKGISEHRTGQDGTRRWRPHTQRLAMLCSCLLST